MKGQYGEDVVQKYRILIHCPTHSEDERESLFHTSIRLILHRNSCTKTENECIHIAPSRQGCLHDRPLSRQLSHLRPIA